MQTQTQEFIDQVITTTPEGERIRLCQQCGSCSGICPYGNAMDFPPQALIASLRAGEFDALLESDTIWLCMSCFACTDACPSKIPLTHGVLANLKSEMLLKGELPEELKLALENARRHGNTLGESPRKRGDWAKDFIVDVPLMARHKKPVDVLWLVGDYASYHLRVRQVSKAMAKVFAALNTSFGILGPEENSDGDVFYLAGEHGLFEFLARKNAKAFAKYEFGEIVTTDPHVYNSLKFEYPKLGLQYTVKHYTQWLHERLGELKPLLKHPVPRRVTYHDPCGLGRANENHIYEEPRQLLQAIAELELVEMHHNRNTSLCCGGGGGGMWLDGFAWEKSHARTSEWRVMEAARVEAEVLAVACPYETPRFEDAVKSLDKEEQIEVKDIAELLAEAIYG